MKKSILLVFFAILFATKPAWAIVNPLETVNNRFGIHIIDESDLQDAAKLVNSSGGQWGYITVVIPETERDREKWQNIFDKMRRLKLIPIVRLATRVENAAWKKPISSDIDAWVGFLSSLNWVVKNRYVVIFNEPNHAKEWGGSVYPEEYAQVLKDFSQKLKAASDDFFILAAGLDASAPNNLPQTMDEVLYLQKMKMAVPDVFEHIDGWNSHSYPNPGFISSPYTIGRGSIQTYQWESTLWPQLGIYKNLPIFITETGWKHREGKYVDNGILTVEQVSQNFSYAFANIWQNPNIVAVTPFLLNYQDKPFDQFSWRKPDSQQFYPQYKTVQDLPKQKGSPEQIHSVKFIDSDIPTKLVTDSSYTFHVTVENTGQSIWKSNENFKLVATHPDKLNIQVGSINETVPTHQSDIEIKIQTTELVETLEISLQMYRDDQTFGPEIFQEIEIMPPPNIFVRAKLWFRKKIDGSDFTLLVYENGDLQKKVEHVTIQDGKGEVAGLRDVVPEREYRFVLLKPFYLPRQVVTYLKEKNTVLEFPRLLPFDFNNDGKMSFSDIPAAIKNPIQNIQRLLP